ncbi:MAG TPA: hypothetical protein VIY48_18940 [Candidatus Paceibacterota bacterium]
MRKSILTLVFAPALILTGCAAGGAVDGVNGQTGQSMVATEEPSSTTQPPSATATEEPAAEPSPTKEIDGLDNVTIKTCKVTEWGAEVTGTIKNSSLLVSDVMAVIEITNPAGDRIDEASVYESAVKPGQKVKYETVGMASDLGTTKITCTVLTYERYDQTVTGD